MRLLWQVKKITLGASSEVDHYLWEISLIIDVFFWFFPTLKVHEEGLNKKNCNKSLILNSLTPKSVLAGTKNSRSEGFLLVKHKHTNIPTMMEPFLPPTAWDLWILSEGVGRGGWWKGFSRINKLNEKIIYFYCLSISWQQSLAHRRQW